MEAILQLKVAFLHDLMLVEKTSSILNKECKTYNVRHKMRREKGDEQHGMSVSCRGIRHLVSPIETLLEQRLTWCYDTKFDSIVKVVDCSTKCTHNLGLHIYIGLILHLSLGLD